MSQTIFDITQTSGAAYWSAIESILFALAIGIGLSLFFYTKREKFSWVPFPFVGLLVLLIIGAAIGELRDFNSLWSAQSQGKTEKIEGAIENFTPGSNLKGETEESFSVNGVEFKYSPHDSKPGYKQTQSNGGVLKGGSRVTIYYSNSRIARIDLHS